MRLKPVLYMLGIINIFIALSMIAPLVVSLIFKDGGTMALSLTILITASFGLFLYLIFKGGRIEVNHRQGFLVVALAWLDISFFGSLPYLFSGVMSSFVDAYFESASGFTTTGASVLTHIADLPHSILFWRSFTHWIGGMGIILLYLAILPLLGVGGMQLYKAEASVVTQEKFVPRVTGMAKVLWLVYVLISLALIIILKLSGMSLFDSLIHAFGTISTGGFSNQNASLEFYNSYFIEAVIIFFMFLGSTNFTLHYRFTSEGFKAYKNNEEFKFYFFMLIIATILVTINLRLTFYSSLIDSIRYGLFQVVSIGTTTGFSSKDFTNWPVFSQVVLLLLMFIGGSAGSTSGSIKCIRILLLLKLGYREIFRLIHPHAVVPVKLGGKAVSSEVINGVMSFTFLYLIIFIISSLILTFLQIDIVTAISSVATTIGGVGPGLNLTGPASNYSSMPFIGKWVLISDMFLGRLEIYTLLLLFTPAFWRR